MQTAQKRWGITLMVALITVALDFASKSWARLALEGGLSRPFLPGVLQLTLTTNTGGAFGIGRDWKEFMTLLAVAICAGIVVFLMRREKGIDPPRTIERIGFGLILGGALGNIADRFLRGAVTDFLEFTFIRFPVFNLADALIDVGVALLLVQAVFCSPAPRSTGTAIGSDAVEDG
jgi:signal peptidase II